MACRATRSDGRRQRGIAISSGGTSADTVMVAVVGVSTSVCWMPLASAGAPADSNTTMGSCRRRRARTSAMRPKPPVEATRPDAIVHEATALTGLLADLISINRAILEELLLRERRRDAAAVPPRE